MGTVRLGNHELLIRLAAGGAANVFLVRDSEHENRLLALKILLPSLAQNQDFLNMFFTEAKIASHLRHPNIVTIAGFGQVDGIHCLAMEYVFGASLSQVLRASARAKKPLTVGVLLRLTAAVCDALHYAHELSDGNGESMGIVHRDVTPQNILLGFNGVPKLTDFGIAKATNRGWETQAGIVKGKFSYMSPEQALGKPVDRRSDIFGTGIVLWEALTGRDLFKGSTPMEVLAAIREHKIEPPSKVVPGLTPIVDPIVMKALRRSPRQRYATSAEMRDDIEELIHRAGVQIDAEAISREFAQIYGDDIGKRALSLKQAILGNVDLETLADALGGTVLNPKQLPTIQGGLNDPDPLGLFGGSADDDSGEVSGFVPARIEKSFAGVPPDDEFDPVDDDDDDDDDDGDLLDVDDADEYVAGVDVPSVPPNRLVTGWDDSTSTAIPEDELLSMISEEDATIGFLPPQFAERFGQALQEALDADGTVHFEDERTVGVPDATLSRLRAISSDDSIAGLEPAMVRPLSPSGDFSVPSLRPVPRAPSVLMEEEQARLRERYEPRAPSWDMDSGSRGDIDDVRPSRPPLSSPPPPPDPAGSAVVVRDEFPAFLLERRRQSGANADSSPADGFDAQSSNTDRAPAPLPFGSYSLTRGESDWKPTPLELEDPVLSPVDDAAPRLEPVPVTVPKPSSSPSEAQPVDWAEPSPVQQALYVAPPDQPESSLEARPQAVDDRTAAVPSPIPVSSRSDVQLSLRLLVLLGLLLLVAGAAVGTFLLPKL